MLNVKEFAILRPLLVALLAFVLDGLVVYPLGVQDVFKGIFRATVGDGPRSVEAGDFNGDGRKDLVVVDAASNDVWIFLGRGDGRFDPGQRRGSGSRAVGRRYLASWKSREETQPFAPSSSVTSQSTSRFSPVG